MEVNYDRVTACLPFDVPISDVELEYASRRGTEVHKAVQFLEEGRLDRATVSEVILPYLDAWEMFRSDVNLEIKFTEKEVVSELYHLKGRVDFIGYMEKTPAVLDLKSGGPGDPNTWPLQLSAYEKCIVDMVRAETLDFSLGRSKHLRRIVVQVTNEGRYFLHSGPKGQGCVCCDFSPNDFSIYNSYLTAYRYGGKRRVSHVRD